MPGAKVQRKMWFWPWLQEHNNGGRQYSGEVRKLWGRTDPGQTYLGMIRKGSPEEFFSLRMGSTWEGEAKCLQKEACNSSKIQPSNFLWRGWAGCGLLSQHILVKPDNSLLAGQRQIVGDNIVLLPGPILHQPSLGRKAPRSKASAVVFWPRVQGLSASGRCPAELALEDSAKSMEIIIWKWIFIGWMNTVLRLV